MWSENTKTNSLLLDSLQITLYVNQIYKFFVCGEERKVVMWTSTKNEFMLGLNEKKDHIKKLLVPNENQQTISCYTNS